VVDPKPEIKVVFSPLLKLMKLLNIGCGSVYHRDWINLDIYSSSPEVIAHDLRKPLPFSDSSFDACYSSHVVEHFAQQDAKELIQECARVLKPNGIIRVVVPDLEIIAKNYLYTLEGARVGNREAEMQYDWTLLELYDQVARRSPGGSMVSYLSSPDTIDLEFIRSRIGFELNRILESLELSSRHQQGSIWQKIRQRSPKSLLQAARIQVAKWFVSTIAGTTAKKAFEQGLFCQSGELHLWMYDQFSLKRLLEQVGFKDTCIHNAFESQIPGFSTYELDSIEGNIRKPDSLFIEGIKA
jgi:SAM-dependent methyltransferase